MFENMNLNQKPQNLRPTAGKFRVDALVSQGLGWDGLCGFFIFLGGLFV